MGWKSIKKHYQIDHIIQVDDGEVKIGSGYIPDLLRVTSEGQVIRSSVLGDSPELNRVAEAIEANRNAYISLLEAQDRFDDDLPVWTYEDGEIVQYQCEEYGWPNVTHCGRLMYENLFFDRRDQAVKAAIKNSEAAVSGWSSQIKRTQEDLAKEQDHLARAEENLRKYQACA